MSGADGADGQNGGTAGGIGAGGGGGGGGGPAGGYSSATGTSTLGGVADAPAIAEIGREAFPLTYTGTLGPAVIG